MSKGNAVIREALTEYKPEIADRYQAMIRRQFAAMVAKLGPTLKNVYNDPSWARLFRLTIAPLTVTVHAENAKPWESGEHVLDDDRLEIAADKYADETVAEWSEKIESKLGSLDNAHVEHLGSGNFQIRGMRGDKKVRIDQTIIINVSSKGKLFNQYPARIYVNGVFTSEANFKKLM